MRVRARSTRPLHQQRQATQRRHAFGKVCRGMGIEHQQTRFDIAIVSKTPIEVFKEWHQKSLIYL